MPKIKHSETKNTEEQDIISIRRFYETKYYAMFLNSFEFPELDQEQQHYLLKQFWKNGAIDAFILPGSIPDKTISGVIGNSSKSSIAIKGDYPNGLLILTPFAISQWNIYDFPTIVTPINTRGAQFFKYDRQLVNKDCVIGYAHTSHASVYSLVMFYIDKIVNVENTINTNLFVHKLPRLIIVSPEDQQRVAAFVADIENGKHKIFLDAEDFAAIKNVLESGGNYIIDKLYQYKESLENELLTLLGVDNIGLEKRERLIVDEANSNNAVINDHSDCFLDTMKAFCKQVTEILGFPLSVRAKSSPAVAVTETEKVDNGGNDNAQN